MAGGEATSQLPPEEVVARIVRFWPAPELLLMTKDFPKGGEVPKGVEKLMIVGLTENWAFKKGLSDVTASTDNTEESKPRTGFLPQIAQFRHDNTIS